MLSREHFGQKELNNAFDLFEELNQLLADRSSEHQIVLRVLKNEPGLLHEITGFFAEFGINLNHIHSFRAGDGHRFLLGLDRSKESFLIKSAIEKMVERGLAEIVED